MARSPTCALALPLSFAESPAMIRITLSILICVFAGTFSSFLPPPPPFLPPPPPFLPPFLSSTTSAGSSSGSEISFGRMCFS